MRIQGKRLSRHWGISTDFGAPRKKDGKGLSFGTDTSLISGNKQAKSAGTSVLNAVKFCCLLFVWHSIIMSLSLVHRLMGKRIHSSPCDTLPQPLKQPPKTSPIKRLALMHHAPDFFHQGRANHLPGLLHELCHLKEHNHGKQYYQLLDQTLPDWRERRRKLNQFEFY